MKYYYTITINIEKDAEKVKIFFSMSLIVYQL